MKLLTRLTLLGAIALSQSAWADTGPYYVYSEGFCNIKKVYLNAYYDVYGYEVGCSSSYGAPIVGTFSSNGAVYGATVNSSGNPCFRSYGPDGSLVVGCSAGGPIDYTAVGRYSVQEAGAPGPVTHRYSVSTEMPDVEKTKNLPNMDN